MSDGKKALADKAIALGSAQAKRRYDSSLPGPSFVEKIQHSILDALILKKVRGALGGEVKFCGNGGAAVSPEPAEAALLAISVKRGLLSAVEVGMAVGVVAEEVLWFWCRSVWVVLAVSAV